MLLTLKIEGKKIETAQIPAYPWGQKRLKWKLDKAWLSRKVASSGESEVMGRRNCSSAAASQIHHFL